MEENIAAAIRAVHLEKMGVRAASNFSALSVPHYEEGLLDLSRINVEDKRFLWVEALLRPQCLRFLN